MIDYNYNRHGYDGETNERENASSHNPSLEARNYSERTGRG